MTWRERAACRGKPTDWWYPTRGEYGYSKNTPEVANALAICAICPVRQACLEAALDHHEPGIWGGLSERERRKMRAEWLRRKVCVECGQRFRAKHNGTVHCSEECRKVRTRKRQSESRKARLSA